MARANARDLVQLVNTAAIALVAYLVWKAFNKGKDVIDDWTKDAAEAWVNFRSPAIQVLGRVQLPNGQTTTIQNILNAGGQVNPKGFFTWQGTTYQITGRNEAGDYAAARIVT